MSGPGGLRRVVLVGFMASGKSRVGAELARRLGWRFIDVDRAVEEASGMRVAEIFARRGEAWFRREEARLTGEALASGEVVIATGGGWAAHPHRVDRLPEGTVAVWLRVRPEEAVRRAAAEPGARPLLAEPDALQAARRLLEHREPYYALAGLVVDTDGRTVEDVTAEILGRLRSGGAPEGAASP